MPTPTPAVHHPDPARVELHIIRVANGWIIQNIALALPRDPASPDGTAPFPPNTPEKTFVATNPLELARYIDAWARMQEPDKASLDSLSRVMAAEEMVRSSGVFGRVGGGITARNQGTPGFVGSKSLDD